MRVVVLNNAVPFLRGGAEHLADTLVEQLRGHGHRAELVRLPFRWDSPAAVAECMAAAATLTVSGADLVVPLKFPTWFVEHERKVCWVLHQFRQVYDLWDAESPTAGVEDWEELRRMVTAADTDTLSAARAVYCNSSVTADRMRVHNDVEATVLLPPHGAPESFRTDGYEDFVLATGRITASKRQHLLVEAMATAPGSWRLVVAGQPEQPSDLERLRAIVSAHGLEERVEVIPEFIADSTKVDLLARARAVAYLPVDEDSYGYVTLEAMLSRKPVITTHDAGGILQLVHHGRTGLVSDPLPERLGEAMTVLAEDLDYAEALGAEARAEAEALDLSWESTIRTLLS